MPIDPKNEKLKKEVYMENIVTIMNFVRGVDHRNQDVLYPTTRTQFEYLMGTDLKSTFLLQHDAVIDPKYTELFSHRNENMEIGVWLETCKSLVLAAGLEWRGREGYEFDWYSNVDTTVAYTDDEKIKLVDTVMSAFKDVYGSYPRTVGAWVLDSVTLGYLHDRYGIDAACICKDQWGTDTYTLFGGYYDNAYYPCKKNILCPAQTEQEQIGVPVFRLLGCDPIYQYDCFLWSNCHVWTLEPYHLDNNALPHGGGSDPEWIDWYFAERFERGGRLGFGYAQVGQENSFYWGGTEVGFLHQMQRLKELKAGGVIRDMTFSEAGRWFKDKYAMSPPCTHTAMSDWRGEGNKSIWYCCKNYRVGLLLTKESAYIRDIHKYDEKYPSIYNDSVCTVPDSVFETLPVLNGVGWSDKATRAGIYFVSRSTGERLVPTGSEYDETDSGFVLSLSFGDTSAVVSADEYGVEISGDVDLRLEYAGLLDNETLEISGDTLSFTKRGYPYSVQLDGAKIEGGTISFDKIMRIKLA